MELNDWLAIPELAEVPAIRTQRAAILRGIRQSIAQINETFAVIDALIAQQPDIRWPVSALNIESDHHGRRVQFKLHPPYDGNPGGRYASLLVAGSAPWDISGQFVPLGFRADDEWQKTAIDLHVLRADIWMTFCTDLRRAAIRLVALWFPCACFNQEGISDKLFSMAMANALDANVTVAALRDTLHEYESTYKTTLKG